jgi:23S rRNA (cytidine1920-2'-O)/16S rRNA (cytidine1409-2'-O)-methyltransferase
MAGEVQVDGLTVDRPATAVSDTSQITVKTRPRFVSRGGEKLDAALEGFGIDVSGAVCADVGASTGGFTDVLLQRGAGRVYAVDVGHGILDYRLRTDARVVVMERTNARYLAQLPEPVSFACIDASFISLRLLLPVAAGWLTEAGGGRGQMVALVKPQFEAGRRQVGKGGIVKDPLVHRQVLTELLHWAQQTALNPAGLIRSPIKGAEGNVEFLVWLQPGRPVAFDTTAAIDAVLATGDEPGH